jgi:hypothetical protein
MPAAGSGVSASEATPVTSEHRASQLRVLKQFTETRTNLLSPELSKLDHLRSQEIIDIDYYIKAKSQLQESHAKATLPSDSSAAVDIESMRNAHKAFIRQMADVHKILAAGNDLLALKDTTEKLKNGAELVKCFLSELAGVLDAKDIEADENFLRDHLIEIENKISACVMYFNSNQGDLSELRGRIDEVRLKQQGAKFDFQIKYYVRKREVNALNSERVRQGLGGLMLTLGNMREKKQISDDQAQSYMNQVEEPIARAENCTLKAKEIIKDDHKNISQALRDINNAGSIISEAKAVLERIFHEINQSGSSASQAGLKIDMSGVEALRKH